MPKPDPVGPYAYYLFLDPTNAPQHLGKAVEGIQADYAQSVEGALENAISSVNDTFASQVQIVADYFSSQSEVSDQTYSDLSGDVFAVQ